MQHWSVGRSRQTRLRPSKELSWAWQRTAAIWCAVTLTLRSMRSLEALLRLGRVLCLFYEVGVSYQTCEHHTTCDHYRTGYNESILRSRRHMLNESPRGSTGTWQKLLTVSQTNSVQHVWFVAAQLQIHAMFVGAFWTWWFFKVHAEHPGVGRFPIFGLQSLQLLVEFACQEGETHDAFQATMARGTVESECWSVLLSRVVDYRSSGGLEGSLVALHFCAQGR